MGWGIAIAAAISAAGTAYSANEASNASDATSEAAKKAQEEQAALLEGADSEIFGSTPQPVDYNAVDYSPTYEDQGYSAVQMDAIMANQKALPAATNLSNATNQAITASNMNRIETWLPGFTQNLQLGNTQAGSLLAGNVPADVARAIAAQTAGNEATLGTAGTSGADMNRNLGLTSLQNIESGLSMLGGLTEITGAVDPLSMQMLPSSMFINPSDAINWQIGENQFDWNADFNNATNQYSADVNNSLLEASADPTASGLFQLNYSNLGSSLASDTAANTATAAANAAAMNSYASILSSALKSYTGTTGMGGSTTGSTGYTGYSGGTNYGYSGSGNNLDYAATGYG